MMGRSLTCPVLYLRNTDEETQVNSGIVKFEFSDLCEAALGSADYLMLCDQFQVILITDVPYLGASLSHYSNRLNDLEESGTEATKQEEHPDLEAGRDACLRFAALVDVAYNSETPVLLSSRYELNDLVCDLDLSLASPQQEQEQDERNSVDNRGKEKDQMWVSSDGGSSSSRGTTMIGTYMYYYTFRSIYILYYI